MIVSVRTTSVGMKKNSLRVVDMWGWWFYTARPDCGTAAVGEGMEVGFDLFLFSTLGASGSWRLLFGNLVEASVASNETDASQ